MGNPLREFNHIDAKSVDEAITVLKQGDAWVVLAEQTCWGQ
jgi:hypothetical protein